MYETVAFAIGTVLMVGAALSIFLQKSMMRAIASLAIAFLGSAIIFVSLGQTFAALLQLFVFVGGLSTYLMVGVSSEAKERKNILAFVGLAIIISAAFSLIFYQMNTVYVPANTTIASYASYPFSGYSPFVYIIGFVLFAAAIGSVIVIRKFAKLVI